MDIEAARAAIESAIPHRPPMLLVDRIEQQDEHSIVCSKTFRNDEYFFQGHYPGYPLVPGVILVEAAMQAGAILLSPRFQDRSGVPVVTRIKEVRFKKMVRPGDTVSLAVAIDDELSDVFFLTAKVLLAGKTAVRFEFACRGVEPPADSDNHE